MSPPSQTVGNASVEEAGVERGARALDRHGRDEAAWPVSIRDAQQRREVQRVGTRVADAALAQALDAPDRLVQAPQPEGREHATHVLGDIEHVGGDAFGSSGELRAQARALRRDAGRAGVAVTRPHHDAALGEHRRGAERVLVGAEQRRDHHVAAGLEPAVDPHPHAVAQAVLDQRRLGIGEPELPRQARRS